MRGESKGQSSIEFLSVYGWMVLVVIIATIGIFFFFGFDRAHVVKESCDITQGLKCADYYIDKGSIVMNVRNNMEWNLGSVEFSYEECGINSSISQLISGENKIFVITGCDFFPGELFQKNDLFVRYTFEGNSIVHRKQFSITTFVEEGDSQSFGGSSYYTNGGTLLLLKLDDVDGETARDETINANHGILKNFSTAVGLWRFNEGNGKNVLDESAYNNDGILGDGTCTQGAGICPIWTAFGVSGPALLFGEGNDRVDLGGNNSLNPQDNITLSTWIYWRDHPNAGKKETIISKGDFNQQAYLLRIVDNPSVRMEASVGGNLVVYPSITSYKDKWVHVAMTYDKIFRKIYVDGSLVASDNSAPLQAIDFQNHGVWIGDFDAPPNAPYQFNGTIDELAIYNATLTPDEIAWHNLSRKAILYRGWSKGKYSGGLQFDGADDFVDLGAGSIFDFTDQNFTIEAWIYLDALPSETGHHFGVFSNTLTLPTEGYWFFIWGSGVNSDKLSFKYYNGGPALFADSNVVLTKNEWHHIAFVRNGTVAKFYVDGQSAGTDTITGSIIAAASPTATIGNRGDTLDRNFQGRIDDIMVSNYAKY